MPRADTELEQAAHQQFGTLPVIGDCFGTLPVIGAFPRCFDGSTAIFLVSLTRCYHASHARLIGLVLP